MGRATVSSQIGETAMYNMVESWRTSYVDQRLTELTQLLIDLTDQVSTQLAKVGDAEADLQAALSGIDNLIDSLNTCAEQIPTGGCTKETYDGIVDQIIQQQKDAADEHASLIAEKMELLRLKSKKKALEDEQYFLTNNRKDSGNNEVVWCADKSNGQGESNIFPAGDAGLITLFNHPDHKYVLPPVSPGINHSFNCGKYGQLSNAADNSVAGCVFNWASQWGNEWFRPKFVWGVLTALDVDADIGTVRVVHPRKDELTDSVVVQDESWLNLPIAYMTCNAEAFAIGDEVVIEVINRDNRSGTIIGFVSNPRGCDFGSIIYTCDSELEIIGESIQTNIRLGDEGTPVTVQWKSGENVQAAFRDWDDGEKDATRQDRVDKTGTTYYHADAMFFPPDWIIGIGQYVDFSVTHGNFYGYTKEPCHKAEVLTANNQDSQLLSGGRQTVHAISRGLNNIGAYSIKGLIAGDVIMQNEYTYVNSEEGGFYLNYTEGWTEDETQGTWHTYSGTISGPYGDFLSCTGETFYNCTGVSHLDFYTTYYLPFMPSEITLVHKETLAERVYYNPVVSDIGGVHIEYELKPYI